MGQISGVLHISKMYRHTEKDLAHLLQAIGESNIQVDLLALTGIANAVEGYPRQLEKAVKLCSGLKLDPQLVAALPDEEDNQLGFLFMTHFYTQLNKRLYPSFNIINTAHCQCLVMDVLPVGGAGKLVFSECLKALQKRRMVLFVVNCPMARWAFSPSTLILEGAESNALYELNNAADVWPPVAGVTASFSTPAGSSSVFTINPSLHTLTRVVYKPATMRCL